VLQPSPSIIAPYVPTKVFPVFGVIADVIECVPTPRQKAVPAGLAVTAA
jgi:hypothetical protein